MANTDLHTKIQYEVQLKEFDLAHCERAMTTEDVWPNATGGGGTPAPTEGQLYPLGAVED